MGHPYSPTYQAPSAPIVPGRTIIVQERSRNSGPGIGSFIAGGVAAGASGAIVDHAISSIFRSGSNHVQSYPSAPPVGTPTSTSTHTVNNYYYGQPGDNGGNSGSSGNAATNPANSGANINQPAGGPSTAPQQVGQPAESGVPQPQSNSGTQTNAGEFFFA